jgi:L-arabinose transport system substrate-binding protein
MRTISMLTTTALTAAGIALAGAAAAQEVKFGYINKMGDHPWFVSEVAGAQAAADELGAELLVQDVQFNSDLTITAFDTMVGDGVQGIAIVVPDRALGPVIAEKAAAAGIPLIAVDDDIYDNDGNMLPYVGMNAENIGNAVGRELARIYLEEGWAEHEVRIASIEDRKADTCMQRNQGAEEAFLAEVPGFSKDNIVRVAYDNTMVNSIDVMTTTLTAYPQVTHWIFYSCNDDGVLGAARALENSGYKPDQGLGIGIDGSRACDAFGAGKPSGFRGTIWLNSESHGATAVALLYDAAVNGKTLPTTTYTSPEFINPANFDKYKDRLCAK